MGKFKAFLQKEKARLDEIKKNRSIVSQEKQLRRFGENREEAIRTEAEAARTERALLGENRLDKARCRLNKAQNERATAKKNRKCRGASIGSIFFPPAPKQKKGSQKKQDGLFDDLFRF